LFKKIYGFRKISKQNIVKLASKISLFDRIDVEMGAALPHSYEFNLEALVERIMEKGDIAFRVCSGHWLMNYINLLKKGGGIKMRYQRKCAKIIINRHYFRHKSEIDSDNQMILYYNMVEATGVEPRK
jgi:hypothetical protein